MNESKPPHPDDHPIERASTTDGLPVSLSLGPTLEAAAVPSQPTVVDRLVPTGGLSHAQPEPEPAPG